MAVVEEAAPATSPNTRDAIMALPSCKDNENLLRIRHSVSKCFLLTYGKSWIFLRILTSRCMHTYYRPHCQGQIKAASLFLKLPTRTFLGNECIVTIHLGFGSSRGMNKDRLGGLSSLLVCNELIIHYTECMWIRAWCFSCSWMIRRMETALVLRDNHQPPNLF